MQSDDTSVRREFKRNLVYRGHGITLKQYMELARSQSYRCAICRKGKPEKYLTIDHDHRCCPKKSSCGKCIRGLLCVQCNSGISMLGDDPDVLENAINYLRRGDLMPAVATVEVKRKRPSKRPRKSDFPMPKYLTEDERERLFKVIRTRKNPRDIALFGLLFYHGLRASEPGTLQYEDYTQGPSLSLDRLFIKRKKGSISADVVLIPNCAQMIRSWIRVRGKRPGPLFITRHKTGISRSRVFQLMQGYGRAAGIPESKLHPHVLKHSCAVDLASYQKESVLDIQAHLGHASINSTMIYTRLLDQAGEQRARRLADWK